MSEEQAHYGTRVNKLWKKKFPSQGDFTAKEGSITRRQLYSIHHGADPKVSTERKIAQRMELPAFITKGYLEGEIEIDDKGNWIVIKTGQVIIQYTP